MNYLIDDIIDASSRGLTKSLPTSPTLPDPPLPPFPALAKRKKTKSVKFPEGASSSAAGSSKLLETPPAAAIPLPDTPAQLTLPLPAEAPIAVETAASPRGVPEAAEPSDYFSAAKLVPPGEPLARPNIVGPSHTGGSTYFSPMSELPPPALEKSPTAEEVPAVIEHLTEPATVAEQGEPTVRHEEEPTAVEESLRDLDSSPPATLYVAHTPIPSVHNLPALLIGISGCPSSGKTTLAHLLSAVLPPTIPYFIIHQDDFLVPEHLMVPPTNGELHTHRHTVNFSAFKRFVEYSKREGKPPSASKSMQAMYEKERAMSRVPLEVLEQLQSILAGVLSLQDDRPIGIVEGDMLYHSETMRSLLDIKILLRASREESRTRRFDMSDDQTVRRERNSWDTREYFDRTLWPQYVKEHAVLFIHDDVEDRAKSTICDGVGILVQPLLDMGVEQVLRWMVDIICRESREAVHRHDREVGSVAESREGAFDFCNCNDGFLGRIRQTIFDFL
ncbi:MAG: hypothetical protein Q9178_006822 [Gyalolechia marmorata]